MNEAFGYLDLDWKEYVNINSLYFRPTEVDYLKSDSSYAENKLKWFPKISFSDLVRIMVDSDLELLCISSSGNGKRILSDKGMNGGDQLF